MTGAPSLLLKVSGDRKTFETATKKNFGVAESDIEAILVVPKTQGAELGLSAAKTSTWLRVCLAPGSGENPWDRAHALLDRPTFAAAAFPQIEALEPDFEQQWSYGDLPPAAGMALSAAEGDPCVFEPQDGAGGKATGSGTARNVGDHFSHLHMARKQVSEAKQAEVLVAHLDTGYDPGHITRPVNLDLMRQRSFVQGDPSNTAVDQVPAGQLLSNRGHGTGTLSLLAGNKLAGTSPGWPGYTDYIGGAPFARIVPVRIADWVVRFTTGTMVQGFDYARSIGAHVLSMSMGGLSSEALVDAVNLAYDAGLFMVTAAGNNYAGRPTPKSTVFPARLKRVLSACGVMANGHAYAGLKAPTMQGNYGPAAKMDTSLGAYTPNVPWAKLGCSLVVDMDGAGTSAATPQIAAAAALWLAAHWDVVAAYPEPWMRVEAIRYALFSSALKTTSAMDGNELHGKLGQGVMQSASALGIQPRAASELHKLPPGKASWSFLDLIFGEGGVSIANRGTSVGVQREKMLKLELTQIAQRIVDVDEAIDDPGRESEQIPAAARNRYLEAALDHGAPSVALKGVLEAILKRTAATRVSLATPASDVIVRKATVMPVPARRLRVYALDPSMAKRLASTSINETVLSVPWDDVPTNKEALQPGPVGEYLEVIDIDPASNIVYDP